MDMSREPDLLELHHVLSSDSYTDNQKRRAYRTKGKILAKMQDSFLKSQRLRLIQATRVDDIDEVNKISDTIQAYEYRTYGL